MKLGFQIVIFILVSFFLIMPVYALDADDECPKNMKKKVCYGFVMVDSGSFGNASGDIEYLHEKCDSVDQETFGPGIVDSNWMKNETCTCDKNKQICSKPKFVEANLINQDCRVKLKFITCTPTQFNPFSFKQKSPLGLQKELGKEEQDKNFGVRKRFRSR